MTDISDAIKRSTEILRQSGIAEPRREAISLLLLAINKDRTFLIAHAEYALTEPEEKAFWEFVERRAKHEPFQHISGKQDFFGLNFLVTPDVLIPRPETELIVEAGIKTLRDSENPKFCEVGIGSGCIAVSILHEIENATATGLDISEKALRIAEKNAERNDVLSRLNLKVSNVFEVLEKDDRFDMVVSNPPYVPSADIQTLQAEVREFDPHIALTDGKDGLSIIRKIIKEAPNYLKQNGSLLMEIGFNQSNKVREMFLPEVWEVVEFFPDLQGIPRMIKAIKK